MNMTEEELRCLLSRNPALKVRELISPRKEKKPPLIPRPKPKFDSEAERDYYLSRILPGIQAGLIVKCELHKTFELLPAFQYNGKKYKNREYTPDFYLEYRDGTVEVVEIKGRQIKKMRPDYPLRRHLFLLNFCIPNNWRFLEVMDDEI